MCGRTCSPAGAEEAESIFVWGRQRESSHSQRRGSELLPKKRETVLRKYVVEHPLEKGQRSLWTKFPGLSSKRIGNIVVFPALCKPRYAGISQNSSKTPLERSQKKQGRRHAEFHYIYKGGMPKGAGALLYNDRPPQGDA